jgi:hypothetical protein
MVRQMVGIMAKTRNTRNGAIEMIEEAVHVLRCGSINLLSTYYIGSLPFIGALLFFWADMSRSAFAQNHISPAALGLALLFVWMKCWHAVFCQKITAYVNRQPAQFWPINRIGRLVATQSILQSSGLFLLPVAMIIVFPFGWAYAFYQNLSSQDHGDPGSLKELYNRSWHLAQLWPRQNHLLILIISFFGLFVFFNVCMTLYLIPVLLKKFLGIETVFSLSGLNILNTTFLITACALTYLCIDPFIKTIYTLRCFYGSSLETGHDIKADLKGFTGYRRGLSYVIILGLCIVLFLSVLAKDARGVTPIADSREEKVITPQELNRSIEEIIDQREFAWRMPREKVDEPKEKMGFLGRFIDWLVIKTRNFTKWIVKWWGKIVDWFKKLTPEAEPGPPGKGGNWLMSVHIVLYIVLAVLVCLLAIVLWRLYQKRKKVPIKVYSEPVVSVPDLTEDFIDPTERPADQWLTMAKDLMQEGSFRLALRAFYLSVLAQFAENELITIAKYKSNLDYVTELERRAHEKKGLLSLFLTNVRTFDRSWYGMHEVTRKDLDVFIANQERMIHVVEG